LRGENAKYYALNRSRMKNSYESKAMTANVMYGLAGAGLVTGAVLLILDLTGDAGTKVPKTGVSLRPMVTADSIGFSGSW